MKIPARGVFRITIASIEFPVYFVDEIAHEPNWFAQAHFTSREIMIRLDRFLDPVDHLIHEACHMHRKFFGLDRMIPSDDEQVCDHVAGFMAALVRANGADVIERFLDAWKSAQEAKLKGTVVTWVEP